MSRCGKNLSFYALFCLTDAILCHVLEFEIYHQNHAENNMSKTNFALFSFILVTDGMQLLWIILHMQPQTQRIMVSSSDVLLYHCILGTLSSVLISIFVIVM